jgi:hypothetical protein
MPRTLKPALYRCGTANPEPNLNTNGKERTER